MIRRWWAASGSAGEAPVDARSLGWLVAALAATTSGHVADLPLWLPFLCLALAAWRLRAARRGATGVPRAWRWAMALALLGGLALSGAVGFGLQAALPMFVAFLWLKLVEVERRRDLVEVGFLAYFLAAAHLLVDGAAVRSGLALLGVAATTAALIQAHRDPSPARGAGRLLAGALPAAALLFLVMPRAPLGLIQGGGGSSGISDRLNAYDMASVALDRTVAFRAEVLTGDLGPQDLWWRAITLVNTDGSLWWRTPQRAQPASGAATGAVQVRLDVAAHRERWLPTLETIRPGDGRTLSPDGTLVTGSPVSGARTVELWAEPGDRHRDRSSHRLALGLPPTVDPRVAELAADLRGRGDDAAVIAAVEGWFAANGFRYTLEPGRFTGDQLAAFLFSPEKAGFCAHFAGAGAVLLRLAGIPARVVAGYRGGEINPLSGQIVVRRLNAHAWIEAWDGEVWRRIDPTALVPMVPGQVPPPGSASARTPGAPPPDDGVMTRMSRPFTDALDAVEAQWLRLVIAFDSETQLAWLRRLGLGDLGWWGLLLVAIPLLALPVAWWWWWSRRPAPGPRGRERAWARLRRRLAAAGHPAAPADGPEILANRLRLAGQPEAAALCHDLALIAYAPPGRGPDERDWIRRAERWRPRS